MKQLKPSGSTSRGRGPVSPPSSGSAPLPEQAVAFKALFRRNDIRALRSGDKGTAVTFEIDNPGDELIDQLNRLMKPDEQVNVGVWA